MINKDILGVFLWLMEAQKSEIVFKHFTWLGHNMPVKDEFDFLAS